MADAPRRHPNVVHLSEIPAREEAKGNRFGYSTKRLGAATGARGIGCSWYEIPPGKTAFPRHFHCANEEALYVLEGEGTVRIGDDTIVVRAGDYVTFPTGPASAHAVINSGSTPLRLLALSTMLTTEIVGYPDSKKIGMLSVAITSEGPKPQIRALVMEGAASAGYYDGEDVG